MRTNDEIQQLSTPEFLQTGYDLVAPEHMVIVGEASEADLIVSADKYLGGLTMYRSSHFHTSGTEMLVMTLPYGKDKHRIKREQPAKLSAGLGLMEGQANEAMFVGPLARRVSYESAVWLGRALATPHIERVYYLQRGVGTGIGHIDGLEEQLRIIEQPIDVVRFVAKDGNNEIPYSQAHGVQIQTEAIK